MTKYKYSPLQGPWENPKSDLIIYKKRYLSNINVDNII